MGDDILKSLLKGCLIISSIIIFLITIIIYLIKYFYYDK